MARSATLEHARPAFLHGADRSADARRAAGDAVALAGIIGTLVAGFLALSAPVLVHVLGGRPMGWPPG